MPNAPSPVPIVGFYFLYFASIGVLLPFLPAYLKTLDLSTTEIGALLAIQPALALAAPPFWAHLADRLGKPARVLVLIGFGAALGFAPLLAVETLPLVALALTAYAFFASAVTTLIDSLALQYIAAHGGAYARLRLFGSLGFVVSSTAFGLAVDEAGVATVVVSLACIAGYALWSLTLPSRGSPPAGPVRPLSGITLLCDREIAVLLVGSCLHWIACAPYHGALAIHVSDLGLSPAVVGLAAGLGVVAEVAVMFVYARATRGLRPRHVLFVAYAATAIRWAGMALAQDAASIIALSLLHGLTFGAFYVASIAALARRVPDGLRATGQALYVAVTFGIGGLVGYLATGVAYDWLGGPALFAVAAGLEVVPALLALALRTPKNL